MSKIKAAFIESQRRAERRARFHYYVAVTLLVLVYFMASVVVFC